MNITSHCLQLIRGKKCGSHIRYVSTTYSMKDSFSSAASVLAAFQIEKALNPMDKLFFSRFSSNSFCKI